MCVVDLGAEVLWLSYNDDVIIGSWNRWAAFPMHAYAILPRYRVPSYRSDAMIVVVSDLLRY